MMKIQTSSDRNYNIMDSENSDLASFPIMPTLIPAHGFQRVHGRYWHQQYGDAPRKADH
jgi:hypothetical protein